jgi:hypothetical protein
MTKYRMANLMYNDVAGEGEIKWAQEMSSDVIHLDMLVDWIAELQGLYDDLLQQEFGDDPITASVLGHEIKERVKCLC